MAGTSSSRVVRLPDQPTTPPSQSGSVSADSDFSPTMSPGEFVVPSDIENPYGLGPPLPGSIAVCHSQKRPTMNNCGAAIQPNENDADSDSSEEDGNNREKVGAKTSNGNNPQPEKNSDKSPEGGNTGSDDSSHSMSGDQGIAGHETNTSGDSSIDMKESTLTDASGTPKDYDGFPMLDCTPARKSQIASSSHDADLSIPSVEAQLAKCADSLHEHRVLPDTKTSSKGCKRYLIYKPHIACRNRSAPPSLRGIGSRSRVGEVDYVNRTNTTVLPTPGTPLHTEIVNYVQRFGVWSTEISNPDRFEKVLSRICEVLYRIWNEGIKQGLIPKRVPVGCELQSNKEIQAILEAELAREKQAKSNKKQLEPAKSVMVDIKRFIHSDLQKFKGTRKIPAPPDYSITAGELSEAGVKWSNVEGRLTCGNLDGEELLVQGATANLPGQCIIPSRHWQRVKPKTRNNPTGRDLKYYCLWEIFRCDAQIEQQENLLEMVKVGDEQQQAAVEAAIAGEQKLRDRLLAIALELDPQSKTSIVLDDHDDDDEDDEDDDRGGEIPKTIDSRRPRERRIVPVSAESSQKTTPVREDPAHLGPRSIPRSNPSTEILVMSTTSNNPKAYFKERDFYQNVVLPKANELLRTGGKDVLDDHIAGWDTISDALKSAKVSTEKRNHLAMEINLFVRCLDSEMDESTVTDVPGYPTRLLIWWTIPPHGLTGEELKLAFSNMHPGDLTWQKLVLSVANYRDGRLFPNANGPDEADLKPLPAGFRPSLLVRLTLKNRCFDPEEYSSRIVNNSSGFRWRYVNTSTIAQRTAMDVHIEHFVNTTIKLDRIYTQANAGKPAPRNGRYDLLGLPNYPDAGAVVHGLWDASKGRAVSDTQWEWFYAGEEKDMTAYLGYKSYEPVHQGSAVEITAWHANRKQNLVSSSQDQTNSAPKQELDANENLLKPNAPTTPTTPRGKRKRKAKAATSATCSGSKTLKATRITGVTAPTTPTKRSSKTSGGVRLSGGRKRKIQQEHDSPRPKRTAGKAPRYTDLGDDEGDEDFEVQDDAYDDG